MNNNNTEAAPSRLSQLFSAARSFKPSSLLDPHYRRGLLNELGVPAFTACPPLVSPTGGAMGVPAELNRWNGQPYHPGLIPYGYYGLSTTSYHGIDNQDYLLRDDSLHFNGNELEEQMVQAAIEASKREDSSVSGVMQRQLDLPDDDEFSRAISLSVKVQKLRKLTVAPVSLETHQSKWELKICYHNQFGMAFLPKSSMKQL